MSRPPWRPPTEVISIKARALNLEVADSIVPERARHATTTSRARSTTSMVPGRRPSATTARRRASARQVARPSSTPLPRSASCPCKQPRATSTPRLRGHADLIDYWERTGAWTQQWTTLRNLADLLDQLEDHDCASLLRRAADEAPEAREHGGRLGARRSRARRGRCAGAGTVAVARPVAGSRHCPTSDRTAFGHRVRGLTRVTRRSLVAPAAPARTEQLGAARRRRTSPRTGRASSPGRLPTAATGPGG